MSRIDTFLELAVKQGGSDLHMISGQAPRIRIHGVLHQVRFRELSVEDMERLIEEFTTQEVRARLSAQLSTTSLTMWTGWVGSARTSIAIMAGSARPSA